MRLSFAVGWPWRPGSRPEAAPRTALDEVLAGRFARRTAARAAVCLVGLMAWGLLAWQGAGRFLALSQPEGAREAVGAAAEADLRRVLAAAEGLSQERQAPVPPPGPLDPAPIGASDPFTAAPPAEELPDGEPASGTPRPEAFRIAGVGSDGRRFYAILAWPEGETKVVQTGDLVNGWRVESVTLRAVRLAKGSQRLALERKGD
ncbi:MAG: hypothetical protein QME79_11180 [Bacillota bacterium]|nr:hypothetical protein [Bacillota bacterium]